MTQIHRKRLKVLFKKVLLNLKYLIAFYFSFFIFYFSLLKIIGFRQENTFDEVNYQYIN